MENKNACLNKRSHPEEDTAPSKEELSPKILIKNTYIFKESDHVRYSEFISDNRGKGISKAKMKDSKEMKLISKCLAKSHFKEALDSLSNRWKALLKVYLRECFISDIFNRKLEKKGILLQRKNKLIHIIDHPSDLNYDCQFDNNMMKNFCTGFINYYKKNVREMEKMAANMLQHTQSN